MAEAAFTIEEVRGWSLTQFAGWNGADAVLEEATVGLCGLTVPRDVGGVTRRDGAALVRVAPDRCWLVSDGTTTAVGEGSAAVGITSLTEGRLRFRLGGAHCRAVLAKCVAIDWDAPTCAPGRAVSTMLHRVPVLFLRHDVDAFDLFVPRTFGQSLREWIADAALEWRTSPKADERQARRGDAQGFDRE